MQIWAAIDLLEGSVVTLFQGRASERTVWKESAVRLAERWQNEGADGLHVVDLDAAFRKGSNRKLVSRIIEQSDIPVQVGGGIRDIDAARAWLDEGAARIVVGTMAYENEATIVDLLRDYGADRITVAADYKGGVLMIRGWEESRGIPVLDAVKRVEGMGVRTVLATSVGRDGTRSGPDLQTIGDICGATRMSVIASGGIRDARDLEDLERAGATGAVLGRALYEGGIKMSELRRHR